MVQQYSGNQIPPAIIQTLNQRRIDTSIVPSDRRIYEQDYKSSNSETATSSSDNASFRLLVPEMRNKALKRRKSKLSSKQQKEFEYKNNAMRSLFKTAKNEAIIVQQLNRTENSVDEPDGVIARTRYVQYSGFNEM